MFVGQRAMMRVVRHARLYDSIATTYDVIRHPDRRIAARIHAALGDAQRVVNIGAGTGNYEPEGRAVVALEPSPAMIVKRAPGSAPVVRAVAESLPFADGTFDAAMATLTLHHWTDRQQGIAEMCRVARRQVIFMFDPVEIRRFWAIDYWPTSLSLPSEQDLPTTDGLGAILDVIEVQRIGIPIDCTDGFGAAFWGRPEAYLDPHVQHGTSWLAQLTPDELAEGSRRLEADLCSGAWDARYGHLRSTAEFDAGYRLVLAGR